MSANKYTSFVSNYDKIFVVVVIIYVIVIIINRSGGSGIVVVLAVNAISVLNRFQELESNIEKKITSKNFASNVSKVRKL